MDGNGAEIVKCIGSKVERRLPIPQEPLPHKNYMDQNVIEFLELISPHFASKGIILSIGTDTYQNRSWKIIWKKIWPLIKDNICGISLYSFELYHLRRRFSPIMICDCPKLRMVNSSYNFPEFLPMTVPALLLIKLWPNGCTCPAGMAFRRCCDATFGQKEARERESRAFFERDLEEFVNSTNPVNLIISLWVRPSADIVPFKLRNNLTGDQFVLQCFDVVEWLLVRCPIERDEEKWAEWENEAAKWDWRRQWNRINVSLNDRDIGDGMLVANEGPS
uniref:Uncharacterized protein n=1 Tax=Globodera rostochiensis TaxID=31243 RepID=A0A914GYA8_GLORO